MYRLWRDRCAINPHRPLALATVKTLRPAPLYEIDTHPPVSPPLQIQEVTPVRCHASGDVYGSVFTRSTPTILQLQTDFPRVNVGRLEMHRG